MICIEFLATKGAIGLGEAHISPHHLEKQTLHDLIPMPLAINPNVAVGERTYPNSVHSDGTASALIRWSTSFSTSLEPSARV